MNDLAYWRIPAILIWIHTRNDEVIETLVSGDAECDEERVALQMARLKIRAPNLECDLPKGSLVIQEKQAKDELLAKLKCDELGARGVKCDPFGNPISDPQDIPTYDWAYLRIHHFPRGLDGKYAAFYRDNGFPSWRHVVCLSAEVRKLWPAKPGSKTALSEKERVARKFLRRWPLKLNGKNPWHGAKAAAVQHIVETFGGSVDATFKSRIGQFISSEVNRLSRQKPDD